MPKAASRRGRPSKGARLYFRESRGVWFIRDGGREISTGCALEDRDGAEERLGAYLVERALSSRPDFGRGDPAQVPVLNVLLLYAQERAPNTRRPDIVAGAIRPLTSFWEGKTVGEVTNGECQRYVEWRTAQRQARFTRNADSARLVGDQTARRELEVLRSAIGYAHGENKLLFRVPVWLPEKAQPRDRWLTRSEAAALVWAAWRAKQGKSRHVARWLLVALYSGTRYDAILRLRWMPNTEAGWVDLDQGIMYRRGTRERESHKKRTPAPIGDRLLAHLRRWRRMSATHVIEYEGAPAGSIKRGFKTARIAAGLGEDVTPHILRHTFATWAVQDGQPTGLVAEVLGTSERIVQRVYGHHAPERLRGVVNAVSRRRGA